MSAASSGRIEAGYRADLVVLDATHPRLHGRRRDAVIDSWIFSGNENLVRDVYVGGNRVIAGQWWQPAADTTPQLSFDEGLAERLGVGIGDTLTFFSAGQKVEAPITSLRKINWDTFRPNFFVVAPPDTLAGLPATYISSFHVDATQRQFINQLIRDFRNLTVIDVEQMISQVRTIMSRTAGSSSTTNRLMAGCACLEGRGGGWAGAS